MQPIEEPKNCMWKWRVKLEALMEKLGWVPLIHCQSLEAAYDAIMEESKERANEYYKVLDKKDQFENLYLSWRAKADAQDDIIVKLGTSACTIKHCAHRKLKGC